MLADAHDVAEFVFGLAALIGLPLAFGALGKAAADRVFNPPRRDPPAFHQLPPAEPPAMLAPRMQMLPDERTRPRVTLEVDQVDMVMLQPPRER